MWDQAIDAVGLIAVAVIGQAVFFSPESRRIRRLRGYLEVRKSVDDPSLVRALDDLIASAVNDEVRARERAKRTWLATLRIAVWVGLAVLFGAAGVLGWIFLGENLWELLPVLASLIAAGFSVVNAKVAVRQVSTSRTEISEAELTAAYAADAERRGLVPETGVKGPTGTEFDLVLRDLAGSIVEVAEVRKFVTPRLPQLMLAMRLRAIRLERTARFVVVLGESPSSELSAELKRLGVGVAHQAPDGTFTRST